MPKNPEFNVGGNLEDEKSGIEVTKLNPDAVNYLISGTPKVNLGAEHEPTDKNIQMEAMIGPILERMKDRASEVYQLNWHGSRVPKGAIVGGHEIAWTQNGEVVSKDGKMIGTYERIIDTGSEQVMLIFLI